ncbi:hypothetical protein CRI85_04165 [Leuconostoc pseudomesenteroides]|uniref:hypothetical protein n=1 Tax=Leuconostoc pseudomesenteroides TaxID=33968 RepID=UPI001E5A79D8|nr:hypothetical protein [Leuconostoc pseudomesenteroides]MCC8439539.1 hypothetical protein [Leuconostoc pseudomesenteroides]
MRHNNTPCDSCHKRITVKKINDEIKKSDGAIIFGIPQIKINDAMYKPKTPNESLISDVCLSTPWNQIEAAIAYAHDIPMMIICDNGIQDGFFENSTSGNFVQRYNLKSSSWTENEQFLQIADEWLKKL